MASIASAVELLQQLGSKYITVHEQKCAVARNRNAKCRMCAEACTSGALSVDSMSNMIVVDSEKCVGCGTCATVCPTGALEAASPSDADFVPACMKAMETAEGEAVIACDEFLQAAQGLFEPAKVVSVTCLGRVEEGALSLLALRGAKKIRLVHGDCEHCPRAVGWQTAQQVAATENELLQTWGYDVRVKLSDKMPKSVRKVGGAAFDASRRAFFHDLKGEAKDAAMATADFALENELGLKRSEAPKYEKVREDGTLPHEVPARRELLLDTLCTMGEPADDMIDTRLFGQVIIDTDACNGCRMCALFCPTGALRKFDDGERVGVEHYPGYCVKCRTCESICPKHCLTISDAVFARDVADGRVDHIELTDGSNLFNTRHAMMDDMRKLTGCPRIYEA